MGRKRALCVVRDGGSFSSCCCCCRGCGEGLVAGPREKRIWLYVTERYQTAETNISSGLHPHTSCGEHEGCSVLPILCWVLHKRRPVDEKATCFNAQITCWGMWWALTICSGRCWRYCVCVIFFSPLPRGLARIWTRACSLFYLNPLHPSARYGALLRKAESCCSLRYLQWHMRDSGSFQEGQTRAYLGLCSFELIIKALKHLCCSVPEPKHLTMMLMVVCIRGAFFLITCPFFCCAVKGSTVCFPVCAFFKLCIKRSGALYQPWQELWGWFCSAYLSGGDPCSLWGAMLDSKGRIGIFWVIKASRIRTHLIYYHLLLKNNQQIHRHRHKYRFFFFSWQVKELLFLSITCSYKIGYVSWGLFLNIYLSGIWFTYWFMICRELVHLEAWWVCRDDTRTIQWATMKTHKKMFLLT